MVNDMLSKSYFQSKILVCCEKKCFSQISSVSRTLDATRKASLPENNSKKLSIKSFNLQNVGRKPLTENFRNKAIDLVRRLSGCQNYDEIWEEIKLEIHWLSKNCVALQAVMKELEVGKLWQQAIVLVEFLEKTRTKPHSLWYGTAIRSVAAGGKSQKAFNMFKFKKNLVDLKTSNFLLKCLLRDGKDDAATELLEEMKTSETCKPKVGTYHVILEEKVRRGDSSGAENCFEKIFSEGLEPDLLIYNTLMISHVTSFQWRKVEDLIQLMKNEGIRPNSVTYSLLMITYLSSNQELKLFHVIKECIASGVPVRPETKSRLISELGKRGNFEVVELIYEELQITENVPNHSVMNSFLEICLRNGKKNRLECLFNENKSLRKADIVSYSTLLKSSVKSGDLKGILEILNEMEGIGLDPDVYIFGTILKASNPRKVQPLIIKYVESISCQNTTKVVKYSILREACVCIENVDFRIFKKERVDWPINGNYEALLDEIPRRLKKSEESSETRFFELFLQVLWKGNQPESIFKCLQAMCDMKIPLNVAIFNIIIACCVRGKKYKLAKSFFERMKELDYGCDTSTFNTLLSGYCKSGDLPNLEGVFDELQAMGLKPNIVTFNILMGTYNKWKPQNYNLKIKMLYDMAVDLGLKPTKVTLVELADI